MQDKLLERARAKQFGHFYVFTGHPTDTGPQKKWMEELIRRYWKEIEGRKVMPSNIRDDADLLWLSPPLNDDDEVVDYKVEDLDPLWKFLPYRGLQAERRFVVIEDTHRIGTTLANKLLKTLEEPIGHITFLWANPMGKKLLPTIESRALSLKLTWPKQNGATSEQWPEVRERFEQGNYPLAEFLEEGKKGGFDPLELCLDMLGHEQLEGRDGLYQQELLIMMEEWQKAQVFNQPMGTRLQQMHFLLSQRFSAGR